jgi:hypothetical protein
MLAIFCQQVAAFLMFALATRLPKFRSTLRRGSQNSSLRTFATTKGKAYKLGLSCSFHRLHKTVSCTLVSHLLPAPYAAHILVVHLASHLGAWTTIPIKRLTNPQFFDNIQVTETACFGAFESRARDFLQTRLPCVPRSLLNVSLIRTHTSADLVFILSSSAF